MIRRAIPNFLRRSEIAAQDAQRRCHNDVLSGPFAGMHYVQESVGSVVFPKLLGTYEMEISGWIEALAGSGFTTIVNIGAGEGYYTCGFALSCPGAAVVAFESDQRGRDLILTLAEKNGVRERLDIRGHCTARDLQAVLADDAARSLVVVDAEGAELKLLDLEVVPHLLRATILVEIHDFIDPKIGATLIRRFQATHRIESLASRPRQFSDLPFKPNPIASFYAHNAYVRLMGEERPATMHWALMRPKPMATEKK